MKRMLLVCATAVLACMTNADAQTQHDANVLRYINQYRSLAMSEQQRTGIPAAIKLAQGIHETGAGTSKLAVEANNHFGLKCKAGWTGGTYAYTDDAPNECFRKYNMDFESYQDQSNYLKSNPRYASLFTLSVTDYAAWAMGLRKAGYATNPKYSQLLIKIIEDYRLQEYTYAAMGSGAMSSDNVAVAEPVNTYNTPVQNTRPANNVQSPRYVAQGANTVTYGTPQVAAEPAATTSVAELTSTITQAPANVEVINTTPPARESRYIDTRPRDRRTVERTTQNGVTTEQPVADNTYNVSKINNLKGVYGKKGDMPLQYAVRNGIRYEKFLEINDLKEEPLATDMPLYLERKHFWGIRSMHLVKPGETMHVISQKEGIQLKYLRDLNYIEEGEEPMPGVTLELQAQAGTKPPVQSPEAVAAQANGDANNSYAPPVRTFPKNPAPPHEEEKPLWVKMKEARQARRDAKEQSATTQPAPQQPATENVQPVQQTESYSRSQYSYSTTGNVKPNPAAQNYPAQNTQPAVTQQPAYQAPQQQPQPQPQTQRTQQPVESYRHSEYSYHTTGNVKPNPATQVEEEEKPSRESRRNRKKNEQVEPVKTEPVQQQQPKSELDALKEQFDNVIYAQKTAPVQQQRQQSYQRPQQQPAYAQNNVPQAQQSQPAPAPRNDAGKMYTVQRGDTAYTIAKKHGITIRQLMDWNGLDFDTIKEGQSLRVKP